MDLNLLYCDFGNAEFLKIDFETLPARVFDLDREMVAAAHRRLEEAFEEFEPQIGLIERCIRKTFMEKVPCCARFEHNYSDLNGGSTL